MSFARLRVRSKSRQRPTRPQCCCGCISDCSLPPAHIPDSGRRCGTTLGHVKFLRTQSSFDSSVSVDKDRLVPLADGAKRAESFPELSALNSMAR
ncbi:hypothetical protein BaRGS_00009253 [Batillaria attramentaria]|uniref:Uncharacterized protein n=1 Tax=Batillaria attramentaria TaxID=370345 RepID=A0ABD0LJA1_9CAEN